MTHDNAEIRPLLHPKVVAHHLGVSTRTLEGWRYRGGGPRFVVLGPRCIRYRPEDVDAFIRDRMATNTCASNDKEYS